MRIKLAWVIFITSAFGAVPASISLGNLSFSGLITIIIFIISLILSISTSRIYKSSLIIVISIFLFWIMSLIWYGVHSSASDLEKSNYPIVWGGVVFIIASLSQLNLIQDSIIQRFNRVVLYTSYLYLIVLAMIALSISEEPATTQVGVIFVSYHLSRVLNGYYKSILPVLFIVAFQMALQARIVVVAEISLMLTAILFISANTHISKINMLFVRTISLFLLCVLVIGAISFTGEKNSGGDAAIEIGGYTINTSGRWYMWGIVSESVLDSPWFGHGRAIPDEMQGIERWGHPHNDYLRILHQLGITGFALWMIFIVANIYSSIKCARSTANINIRVLSRTTFFSLIGISIVMLTDNAIVYSYVIYPLSALIGFVLSVKKQQPK